MWHLAKQLLDNFILLSTLVTQSTHSATTVLSGEGYVGY